MRRKRQPKHVKRYKTLHNVPIGNDQTVYLPDLGIDVEVKGASRRPPGATASLIQILFSISDAHKPTNARTPRTAKYTSTDEALGKLLRLISDQHGNNLQRVIHFIQGAQHPFYCSHRLRLLTKAPYYATWILRRAQ